ncbi:MAG: peptide chain release factor N(5)-glutamine methyltransferase [Ruminococcus sp.]
MTLIELYARISATLKAGKVSSPAFEAQCLIASRLKVEHSYLIANGDREVEPADVKALDSMAKRRIKGEPLQYITGSWEFLGRSYRVGKGVLIPRDDTEVVLRCTFSHLDKISKLRPAKIIDLCSGSGILAITLKCLYPTAQVTAVELSKEAIPYLKKNIREHSADITVVEGDILKVADKFAERDFDLIIGNPPYIKSEDMKTLQKEVQFEPALALDGGADGFDLYRELIPLYTCKLRQGGMLALELDAEQALWAKSIMEKLSYESIEILDDLGGVHRAINGTLMND